MGIGTPSLSPDMSAGEIVDLLGLKPHPEGGYFCETFRDAACCENGRSASTAIYFLLAAGQVSAWHRVDAVEIWHWYAGAPLILSIAEEGAQTRDILLGPSLGEGERPQAVVPRHAWQMAKSAGDWTLVGCTVAPGFEFAGFELAPKDWQP